MTSPIEGFNAAVRPIWRVAARQPEEVRPRTGKCLLDAPVVRLMFVVA
jgi:hypothetical protein